MTNRDINQVQEALSLAVSKVAAVRIEGEDRAVQFVLPFVNRNGEVFTFYAYRRPGSKKIFLTDAGGALQTLRRSGLDVEMGVLQKLMATFGLIVLEDGTVLEQSNRPLWQRVTALFQALVTADGVMRTWTLPKEK